MWCSAPLPSPSTPTSPPFRSRTLLRLKRSPPLRKKLPSLTNSRLKAQRKPPFPAHLKMALFLKTAPSLPASRRKMKQPSRTRPGKAVQPRKTTLCRNQATAPNRQPTSTSLIHPMRKQKLCRWPLPAMRCRSSSRRPGLNFRSIWPVRAVTRTPKSLNGISC